MARRQQQGRAIDGILLLDKPLHLSSNQALQKVKRLFNANKAGHTGSLDPLATGMLPICLGKATKLSSLLLDSDKQYRVSAKWGESSSTGDAEGEKTLADPLLPLDPLLLKATLSTFKGTLQQIPPMYSALKKDGKPLYQLARLGVSIEREARAITIYDCQLLDCQPPVFTLQVHCSKGTYIRTLVEDIAKAMSGQAYVTALRRHAVGQFQQQRLYSLEELEALVENGGEAALDACLLSVEEIAKNWPKVVLSANQALQMQQGQKRDYPITPGVVAAAYQDNGQFLGIIEANDKSVKLRYWVQ